MSRLTAAARWSVLLVALSGCGGGNKGGPAGSFAAGGVADLTSPGLDLSGGDADSAGAGGEGGTVTVRSGISFSVGGDAAPAPLPAPAAVNTVSSLSGDQVFSGTTVLSEAVTGSGSITVNGGDLFITGTVTTGGGAISLRTTSGSIHLTGTIDTSGAGGGSGGAVTMDAAASIELHGAIVTNGGSVDATSDSVRGGAGGSITIAGRNEITITSALRFRGGAASTTGVGAVGGDGGSLAIDAAVPVRLYGTFDGRGGPATASGGEVRGGHGGRISIGTTTPVVSVTIQGSRFAADGGSGAAAGGKGGTFDLLASSGGIALAGTFSASGGGSGAVSGAGGSLKALCDVGGGDLVVHGTIRVVGGSASAGSTSASGGAGGSAELTAWFDSMGPLGGTGGSIILDPPSQVVADGGGSGGSAPAGKGGTVHLEIPQGAVTMSGSISARGGSANGSGAGGLGGLIWVASDANANATGGAITLETGAVLDASGGDSASGIGGDAQWSTIPVFQAGTVPIAVLLDSDSVVGGPNPGGLILNKGTIFARGGSPNGHGGDVEFHGAGPSSREPDPGDILNEGNGSGGNGVFVAD